LKDTELKLEKNKKPIFSSRAALRKNTNEEENEDNKTAISSNSKEELESNDDEDSEEEDEIGPSLAYNESDENVISDFLILF
jgi:hypothetical protein